MTTLSRRTVQNYFWPLLLNKFSWSTCLLQCKPGVVHNWNQLFIAFSLQNLLSLLWPSVARSQILYSPAVQTSYVIIVSVFKIVGNINQAQEPDNYSFSLFSICNSIAGYLYLPKMKRVGNVMTYLTISGEGFSTGKSLCTDICMITLYGERLDCTAPTTIPKLYEMLASGTPIFGKTRSWANLGIIIYINIYWYIIYFSQRMDWRALENSEGGCTGCVGGQRKVRENSQDHHVSISQPHNSWSGEETDPSCKEQAYSYP